MNFNLMAKDINIETYILTGMLDDTDIINNLINFVKKNKDENLSYKTNVKGHFTGFQSLVQNKYFINFLEKIKKNIQIVYQDNFIINSAWGNICAFGEEITEHDHIGVTAFSGILYLTEGGPGTYFKEYDLTIEEKIGKYVLFSPILKHSVKKLEKNIERITVAFNMNQIKKWEEYSQMTWVNKK
jgi:hypothetical protein